MRRDVPEDATSKPQPVPRSSGTSLKSYLLAARYAGAADDAFDRALRAIRTGSSPLLVARHIDLDN